MARNKPKNCDEIINVVYFIFARMFILGFIMEVRCAEMLPHRGSSAGS